MIDPGTVEEIIEGLKNNSVVPYLGPGVLDGVVNVEDGTPIPASSDSLILAMNDGKPMAPRLMYEFPRAAMNLELKKGRSYVERFLTETYGNKKWSSSKLHSWLAEFDPKYVIDINRDTQLQSNYTNTPHNLIVGIARIGGTDYRFKLYHYDGATYKEISNNQELVDTSLPILFKPMGTPIPEPSYIASDADYVDYITELMGGFSIPTFLKSYRENKRYLLLGVNLTRDTERMVMSDMTYGANQHKGWAFIPNPTDKEKRFCKNQNIDVIESDWNLLLEAKDELLAVGSV